ncbi:MAG: hypothetical protein WD847_20895 [Pirellulales bacterium]
MNLHPIGWLSRILRSLVFLAAIGVVSLSMTGCVSGQRSNMPQTVDEWMAQPRLDP